MHLITLVLAVLLSTFAFGQGKPKLTDFKKNVYSQWGEDGMIEKIFEIIGKTNKIAIEFGAYDGLSLSNTANLWTKDPSWTAVLIEPNSNYYNNMLKNVAKYSCITIEEAIGTGKDSLESVLSKYDLHFPVVDILSIDVDGNDYQIFEAIENLRARLIIIEYNPSIPAHLDVYSNYHNSLGCSVAALKRLATQKGYSLVGLTDTNCFFVQSEDFPKFAELETDLEHIRIDRWVKYLISDYKAHYQIIGTDNCADPWGWTDIESTETFHGNITKIPAHIKRK